MYCVIKIATGEVIEGPAASAFERWQYQAGYAIVPAPAEMLDRRKWKANATLDGVELRPLAEREAIDAKDLERAARPAVALGKIAAGVKALLAETDAETMARVNAYDAAGLRTRVGQLEVLIKHLIPIIRPNMKEDVE